MDGGRHGGAEGEDGGQEKERSCLEARHFFGLRQIAEDCFRDGQIGGTLAHSARAEAELGIQISLSE